MDDDLLRDLNDLDGDDEEEENEQEEADNMPKSSSPDKRSSKSSKNNDPNNEILSLSFSNFISILFMCFGLFLFSFFEDVFSRCIQYPIIMST